MRLRLALTLALMAAAGAAPAAEPSMKTIMAEAVNPGALAFWAGGNDPPDGETPAQAKARWAAAVRGARILQQKGAIMMQPPYIRSGHWNDYAQLMIEQGRLGEAASRAQDAPRAFDIGGRLYDACAGCHRTYVPRRDSPT